MRSTQQIVSIHCHDHDSSLWFYRCISHRQVPSPSKPSRLLLTPHAGVSQTRRTCVFPGRPVITAQLTPRALCFAEASNGISKASPPVHVFLFKLLGTQLASGISRSLWLAISNCSLELFLLLPLAKHPLKVSDHETHYKLKFMFPFGLSGNNPTDNEENITLISTLGFIILHWLFSDFIWYATIKRYISSIFLLMWIFGGGGVPANEFILPNIRQSKEKQN